MKMNMPVMEIIKFDSNDVIATSGSVWHTDTENCYQLFKNGKDGTYELFNCDTYADGPATDFDFSKYENGTFFDYVNGTWVQCNHRHER